jgi:hypothetical protein
MCPSRAASPTSSILIGLLPVALLASAVQAFIGLQSKTFKEAQAQGNLLILVPMVPGFLVAFGASLPEAAAFTPIIGHQLLVEEILKGQNPRMLSTLVLSALTLAIAGGAVVTMSRQLNREAAADTAMALAGVVVRAFVALRNAHPADRPFALLSGGVCRGVCVRPSPQIQASASR